MYICLYIVHVSVQYEMQVNGRPLLLVTFTQVLPQARGEIDSYYCDYYYYILIILLLLLLYIYIYIYIYILLLLL